MAPCAWVHPNRGMFRAAFLCCNILWMCVAWGLFDFIEGMCLCMSFSLSYEGLWAGGVWVRVEWGAVCFH